LVLRWLDAGIKMAAMPQPLAVFTFTGANMNAGSEASEEKARLRAKSALGPLAIRPLLAIQHRLRKFSHGAYQPRNVEISIFTLKSPGTRQTFRNHKLGFGWPKTS
jgi:hypothetical protein